MKFIAIWEFLDYCKVKPMFEQVVIIYEGMVRSRGKFFINRNLSLGLSMEKHKVNTVKLIPVGCLSCLLSNVCWA
jgi:hypothetical protein